MPIVQAMCTSFKNELASALHNFDISVPNPHIFRFALFRARNDIVGNFGPHTTNYSEMGEDEMAASRGYPTGGIVLSSVGTGSIDGTTAIRTFQDTTIVSANIIASGGLIYNQTSGNRAVAVYDFGGDVTSNSNGNLRVRFPPATAESGIIRLN